MNSVATAGFEALEEPHQPRYSNALLTGSTLCAAQAESPFFAKLPREIRGQIYHSLFVHPHPPRLFYRAEQSSGVEIRVDAMPTSILYACRQTFVEAWPELTSSIELYLTYTQWDPSVPSFMPPVRVCHNIRKMVLSDVSDGYEGQLQELPDFSKFPALQNFVIRRVVPLHVLRVAPQAGWSPDLSGKERIRVSIERDRYENTNPQQIKERLAWTEPKWRGLTDDQKLELVKESGMLEPSKIVEQIQKNNKDNWVSKLVAQGKQYNGVWKTVDAIWDVYRRDYEDPDPWPTEEEEAAEEERKAIAAVAAEKFGRAIIGRMTTSVETDYHVAYNHDWSLAQHTFDVITVVVDVDTQAVTGTRWLTAEETARRQVESTNWG